MKHVFIINPKAGKKDITPTIMDYLTKKGSEFSWETYITTGVNDAYNFTKQYLQQHSQEEIRFYVCGGDGTLNEVVNGLVSYPKVSVACYPSGSGNDFIKNFGTHQDFINLDKLICGYEREVDLLKVNNRYTINICNLGFDAVAADNMSKFKKKKGVSGKMAYTLGVLYSLLHSIKSQGKIYIDDVPIDLNEFLLCTIANGICYGGGYYCAPNAQIDDGLLDITVVKPLSRIKFMSIINIYKKGQHLNHKKVRPLLTYQRGKKVEIISNKSLIYCMDGEIAYDEKLTIEVYPKAIKFVIPHNIT